MNQESDCEQSSIQISAKEIGPTTQPTVGEQEELLADMREK
jgi:hypothetical protein